MLKRILSAIVGIAVLLLIIFLGMQMPIVIDIAISIISAIAVGEFAYATKTFKIFQISVPSIMFALVFPMLLNYSMGLTVWYIYTAIMLAMMVFNHKKINFVQFSYIYSMTLVITISLSTIILMKEQDISHSIFYFVLALALPWLADIGAYFAGTFLGKHKLCPEISPKKTIEGAIGGTVLCVLATCLLTYIFGNWVYNNVQVNYINLIILSFIGSGLSIIGDLSFSLVKRTFKIKDYGTIIPGHGGMLDRFDSVIFVSPFLFIMIRYLPILVM